MARWYLLSLLCVCFVLAYGAVFAAASATAFVPSTIPGSTGRGLDVDRARNRAHARSRFLLRSARLSTTTRMTVGSPSKESSQSHTIPQTRRDFVRRSIAFAASFGLAGAISGGPVLPASAKASRDLERCLYTILRVREATEQETRLITTGKFKDVQRANVKLAVRFMLQNYRLSDNFIAASAYLDGSKRIAANDVGQSAVQSLYTILEYFDSSDVQNLKVGSTTMAGKEDLVLKGLATVRNRIDDFLSYFPQEDISVVKKTIEEENALNEKEFDTDLGTIINLKPTK